MKTACSHSSRRCGFTLIELSIVLVIIALITGMSVSMGLGMMESARRVQTTNKLDAIEAALMAYRTVDNRLPCPADASLATTDANYGAEAANPGTCTGGTPAANFNDTAKHVVEGAVPFKVLNLPEEFMYDGWGRKFAYAVNQHVTGMRVMAHMPLSEQCGISVTDAGGAPGNRTTGAVYALASFGPDGHGGYTRSGIRMNSSSTNADELTNCHCNSSASATTYAASYVMKEGTTNPALASDTFDDFLRFKERWQMMTMDDPLDSGGAVCSTGFRIDGTGSGQKLTPIMTADLNGDGVKDLILRGSNPSTGGMDIYVIFGQSGNSGFPSSFKTTDLNGANGFVITTNGSGYGQFSSAVVRKGDFNGDGIDDLAIGYTVGNNVHGRFFVLYGQHTWPSGTMNLSTLNNTTNPQITTISNNDAGIGGLAVGDINGAINNGHNVDDLILGNQDENGNKGNIYVVWGNATPPASISVTALGTSGVTLAGGMSSSRAGYALAVGDFDGDGIWDLLIGAPNFGGGVGYAYIVWGHMGTWSGFMLDGSVTAGTAVQFTNSAAGSMFGEYVTAGDADGNGKNDAIVVAPNATASTGGATGVADVFFNGAALKSAATFSVGTINGANAVILQGKWGLGDIGFANPMCGNNNIFLADITGDGKKDLLTGASGSSCGAPRALAFFSHATPWTNPMGTEWLTGSSSTGFRFTGFGSVSGMDAGDMDGDGIGDFIVGDGKASPGGMTAAGAVYILKGKASGWPSTYDTSTFSGNGYEIDGASAGDNVGSLVVGDFNGDGIKDIAIGATGRSPNGVSGAGSVYVLWGTSSGWTTPYSLGDLN